MATSRALATSWPELNPTELSTCAPAQSGMDAVIVDTAGRLQIDEAMMAELAAVKAAVRPTDTLLVVDAMTGQEAATLVKAFNDAASITGANGEIAEESRRSIAMSAEHITRSSHTSGCC